MYLPQCTCVLSFYHVGTWDQTQIISLYNKCLYPMNHLAGPTSTLNSLSRPKVKVIIRKRQESGPSSLSSTPRAQHAAEGHSLGFSLGCDTSCGLMISEGLNHQPGAPQTHILGRPQLKQDIFRFRTRALARSKRSWKSTRDVVLEEVQTLNQTPHSKLSTRGLCYLLSAWFLLGDPRPMMAFIAPSP